MISCFVFLSKGFKYDLFFCSVGKQTPESFVVKLDNKAMENVLKGQAFVLSIR